jgi:Tfp pilus assembly protein PilF
MNKFRRILEESLRAASAGELNAALLALNQGIRDAKQEDDKKWLVLLSKNAGLLFEQFGKPYQAKIAYRTALKHNESDAYLHLSLAQLCEKLGQDATARRHFAVCHKIAVEQDDEDLLEILKKVARQP